MGDPGCPIRRGRAADVRKLEPLFREYMEFHRRRDSIYALSKDAPKAWSRYVRRRLRAGRYLLLIAEVSGRIVGFATSEIAMRPPVFRSVRYGMIGDVAVTRRFRRKGIATLLVRECRRWLFSQGVRRVELRVLVRNAVSRAFWRKMGFRPYIEVHYGAAKGGP